MTTAMLHTPGSFENIFQQPFEVLVLGGGYIGLAAALHLRSQGRKVLLVEPGGDPAWESGRAMFAHAGDCAHPLWQALVHEVERRMPATQRHWLDPALAEVVATQMMVQAHLTTLYYARPVMVEQNGEKITGLILATKSGFRRVVAERYIDASESGTLACLLQPGITPRPPAFGVMSAYLQRTDWSDGHDARFESTPWQTQRQLQCKVTSMNASSARAAMIELLVNDAQARESLLSHMGVQPFPIYNPSHHPVVESSKWPSNLYLASPGWVSDSLTNLAQRFTLGLSAAERVMQLTPAKVLAQQFDQPMPPVPDDLPELTADVLVAGGGTGGALAACASAQTGATTLCLEPLAFLGGIGTGGGINAYYFGVTGGMQQQIDQRVKELMHRGGRLFSGGSFHPDVKKHVLEQMLLEAGVKVHLGTMLAEVEKEGERVVAALLADEHGLRRVRAKAYIDGTGDGDLCAMAGANFTHGRHGDGLPHAYSQSGGMLRVKEDQTMATTIVNFDAGWCDATDAQDLTRARMVGLLHYLRDHYNNLERPTYIAPAIGLRQSRQVVTDHVVSLDDLVMGRRFDDAIGYSGCHYDNHAVDYDQESDESMFWIWLNRNWRNPVAAQMPYRMLLPRGLANVWIASRCAGVSQDAHHSLRMQRDMQRIGEAAGIAAALCAKTGAGSRQVDQQTLKQLLMESGALKPPEQTPEAIFGWVLEPQVYEPGYFERSLQQALVDMDAGRPGRSIWWLYRHREEAQAEVRNRIGSEQAMVSWLAAGIGAMWDDPAAEPRLMQAIEMMEYGFDGAQAVVAGKLRWYEETLPEKNRRLAPNWLVATGLLRCCGTAACLPVLEKLIERDLPVIGVRTTIASTLYRLIEKGRLTDAQRLQPWLDRLLTGTFTDEQVPPQRMLGAMAQAAARGQTDEAQRLASVNPHGLWMSTQTSEEHRWRLHYTVAQARVALGLPMQTEAEVYLRDPRKLVRDAFMRVLAKQGVKLHLPMREKVTVKTTQTRRAPG